MDAECKRERVETFDMKFMRKVSEVGVMQSIKNRNIRRCRNNASLMGKVGQRAPRSLRSYTKDGGGKVVEEDL